MKKLQILYVSNVWTGLEDFFFRGGEPKGMPAFVRPLIALIERGHHVDLLLATGDLPESINPATLLQDSKVRVVSWSTANPITQWRSVRRVWKHMDRMIKQKRYDFVYGQGAGPGTAANLRALHWKIPCGLRLYGTVLGIRMKQIASAAMLQRWKHRAEIVNWSTIEIVGWRIPKKFLLITHDGSGGDVVYEKYGRHRYEFCHWRNGVSLPNGRQRQRGPLNTNRERPFILYVARIQRWKRQDRLLNILQQLRDVHEVIVDAKFVGAIVSHNEAYYCELLKQIESMGLSEQVQFAGSLPYGTVDEYYACDQCLCAGSLYDWCNLGNAALEAVTNGAILLGAKDGTLDDIVEDGTTGYLVGDDAEAAERVLQLLRSPDRRARMRAAAARLAAERLETWDDRAKREIELVESATA